MSVSRRRFLQWAGAANLAVVSGKTVDAASLRHYEGYPDSRGVLFDNTLCIGCRRCEQACNQINAHPEPEIPFDDPTVFDQPRRPGNTTYTVVNRYHPTGEPDRTVFRKIQCNHCLEPACAAVCFVKAFRKDPSGAVVYDASVCVGCRYCIMACPFNIPSYEYDNAFNPLVRKCTLCHPRITEGLLPACVEICPSGALLYGKRTDLIKIARQRIAKNPDGYIDHIYGEREMGGTSWLYLSSTPFEAIGQREDLGNKPAIEFTAGSLSAVPMVIGLWPVLLVGTYAIAKRNAKTAQQEKTAAIDAALTKAQAEAEKQLAAVREKAETTRQKEVEKAVKSALEKAAAEKQPAPEA
jgi:formate dehydrogenase iron-sulfur subunit